MPSSDPPTLEEPAKPDAPASQSQPETSKISGAELKKQKQAEKAARRAQAIQEKQTTNPAAVAPDTATKNDAQKGSKPQQKRRGSASASATRDLPVRSQKATNVPTTPAEPKKEDKTVEFFRHLYKPRMTSIAGAGKDIHPAVLALGMQMSDYTICGSCARLVATMQAFKEVIKSYTTPAGATLKRHIESHVLRPQINYLTSCRRLSISMGNAINWLKHEIGGIDIDIPETEAKKALCDAIDVFVRERLTFADQVIASTAAEKIRNGDVILTYAKSSIVQKTLVKAHTDGKEFRVIVVDSRPLYEGKYLAASLANLGLEVKYCLISGLSHNIQEVTKVMLGAHAMTSNGRLFSRIGTAVVAMEANEADKPVIVLCETIKFTERVALDSIVLNEIAPADELIIPGGALEQWRDTKNLQLCNPMYDVTPAEYIQMIVTESGVVPPTSVPVLYRLMNEREGLV